MQKFLHPCGASNKGLDNSSHATLKSTHLECCGHPSTGLPQRANRHHAGSEQEQIVGAIGPESIGRAPDCILRKADEVPCAAVVAFAAAIAGHLKAMVLAVSRLIEAPMRPDGAGMIQLASLLWAQASAPSSYG